MASGGKLGLRVLSAEPLPVPSGSTRRSVFLLAVGLAITFITTSCGDTAPDIAKAGTTTWGGNPVLLIGIDGVTWDVIDPMIERGELPTFKRLCRTGLRGDLISLPPSASPVLWTTMATGRFPRHHNILHFTYPYRPGPRRIVESDVRQVPALWNVASRYQRSVGVVAYYVTHPVERINGFMVSDRACEGLDDSVYPAQLAPLVSDCREQVESPRNRAGLLREFIPWDYDPAALQNPEDPYHRVSEIVADRIVRRLYFDEFTRKTALRLLEERVDLSMVYFRIVDNASHAGWQYYDSSDFDQVPDPFEKKLLQDLIPSAYRYMDTVLEEILSVVGSQTNVVIVSDHGFGSATGAYAYSRSHKKFHIQTGYHRPDGIFLATGPDFRPGTILGLTVMEVAPLLLTLLQLPISDELPGKVVDRVFRPGFLREFPPTRIPRYPGYTPRPVERPRSAEAEIEERALRELEALGYISHDATELADRQEAPLDFWSIEPEFRRRALLGELLYHSLQEDNQAVERFKHMVREKQPGLMPRLRRDALREKGLYEAKFGRPFASIVPGG